MRCPEMTPNTKSITLVWLNTAREMAARGYCLTRNPLPKSHSHFRRPACLWLRVHLDSATVVASAVSSRGARCTELAGDSQRYNAHPFSDGGTTGHVLTFLSESI